MKALSLNSDAARSVVFVPSDTIYAYVGTGSSQTVTIPSGAKYASFAATGNFFVKFANSGTAVIPTTNVTDGTASALNPTVRDITGLTSFGVISSVGTTVVISFYND